METYRGKKAFKAYLCVSGKHKAAISPLLFSIKLIQELSTDESGFGKLSQTI